MEAGYSKTPLFKKLGLKDGQRVCFIDPPENFFALFEEVPDVVDVDLKEGELDYVHIFTTTTEHLTSNFANILKALKKTGMLWVSWPKKTSALSTEVDRELVRELVLKTGLVDSKVCAIDQDWTGLKFVYRLKDR